ncbi:DNA-binding MarR family transcriptional regulator [Lipingzhangella halophila]|uniref:DNA-binding MarR family transcriptional regulator n=1 Tax=Lipingzhangella halophila TaxID=1783352 RepID=A0A7W7RHL9_9ACTN|nr:transcriptional regulator [Lipingzhangella halophila]MBB4931631.1 DNA-binding MarR family transcriptional regulator [Lipingzhangella halophila]
MAHARARLDEAIHAPVRFSIVATLAAASRADFKFVRDTVEITDSALSKQVSVLEKAGYVAVTKTSLGRRPRTWLSLTAEGRRAFERHVRALRDIAAGVDLDLQATPEPPDPNASLDV